MNFVGEHLGAKGAQKLFGQVWGNSGKYVSYPQSVVACSVQLLLTNPFHSTVAVRQ